MRTLHWFRSDLRLQDNPALTLACQQGAVLPVFIIDTDEPPESAVGAASRAWLDRSLHALNASLGGGLLVDKGRASELLPMLCQRYQIDAVTWNRCYEPYAIARDTQLKQTLKSLGCVVSSCSGSLLYEPWVAVKKDGTAYRVFTPFYKHCQANLTRRSTTALDPAGQDWITPESATDIEALGLRPSPEWDQGLLEHWVPGEAGAEARLSEFLASGLTDYRVGRDYPAERSVSRLSPHLHHGEISPHQILERLQAFPTDDNHEHFVRELVWREFAYHLLYHFPELPHRNLQSKFDHFPWTDDAERLAAWQQGRTGYPIVDAGMRELWQTGSMHNRVRMIVASFLVKNLRLHWQHGLRWFWDCLVDADLASNSASWQWCAGSGADAAPYFRIFNPITQGQRFDPKGEYTKRFLPELAAMPSKYLFEPWNAPAAVLHEAGVILGENYPQPIVDVKASREAALEAFAEMKRRAAL